MSRGLGHMHPKLVKAKFIRLSDFSHVLVRAAVAEWLKAPVLKS